MSDKDSALKHRSAIGFARLIEELALDIPHPTVRSEARGSRLTRLEDGFVLEQYRPSYAPQDLFGHLKFAMRYEPIDLRVVDAIFRNLDRKVVEEGVRSEPTSAYVRRIWYLYELLTQTTLDVSDVPPTAHVDLLNPDIHFTASGKRIRRQRINDNLLGNAAYCPLVRRTETLKTAAASGLDKEAKRLVEGIDPTVLARAVSYLYTQETRSSYAIESEAPSANRTERFVAALANAQSFNTSDISEFIRLQNAIVDPRYAQAGWRTDQNYVGQAKSDFSEHVHYVCPRPEDVPALMQGWMQMVERLKRSDLDPVVGAAVTSFGFVFNHPFDDGNGRIHRFLIHHMLTNANFTPDGLLLPVSAVMLREKREYDRALNTFSSPILPFIRYELDREGHMTVLNDTAHLYRFWDATRFAEYLYSCVAETVRKDIREEIGFLTQFDEALRRTMNIVDMPNRRASLLVRLILQNNGKLAKGKRTQFAELKDEEIVAIEGVVQELAKPT